MDGTCNCGAIKVHIEDAELFSKRRGRICHYINCQETSGSTHGTNIIIPASSVTLTGADNLTLYEDTDTISGGTVERYFYKTCGNPIKSETKKAAEKGNTILKLGIFAGGEKGLPVPKFEAICKSKQDWLAPTERTKRFMTTMAGEE